MVEHNKFCVSAHFRNCAADNWHKVVSAVDAVVSENPELHITRGRKVLEVRPQVDWDKGRALTHLLEVLGLKSHLDVVSLYIGDDKTDEDAFRVLQQGGNGVGILVSTKVKQTSAAYTVRDPQEVQAFLWQLCEYGRSESNGWLNYRGSCNGWTPAHQYQLPCIHEGAEEVQPATLQQQQQGQ